jgi:hypothetical protein
MKEVEIETIKEVICNLKMATPGSYDYHGCPGWDKPFDPEKTCRVCSSIQDLFTLLGKKKEVVKKKGQETQ